MCGVSDRRKNNWLFDMQGQKQLEKDFYCLFAGTTSADQEI
jgi:hypothetical protein